MARDLANGKVFPVSEAVIMQTARKHGIGRKMGRAIIFSPEDCHRLYEVLPCPSGSSAAQNHPIGSFAENRRIRVEESTGTDDKKIADEIRAKREAELLPGKFIYGCRATATFAQAALSYLEQGGSTRYLNKIIANSGTTVAGPNKSGCNRPWSTKLVPERVKLDPYPAVLLAGVSSPQARRETWLVVYAHHRAAQSPKASCPVFDARRG